MITIEKEIKVNGIYRKPGYDKDMYTDGIQTTVKLFGIPVYRNSTAVDRVDENQQAAKQDKKPIVMRFRDGTTINLYEPVAILSRTHLLCTKDMSHVTAISKDAIREPTKWEVLRAVYSLLRHRSNGKGLSRNFFSNTLAKFRAAPWKASHASCVKETF